MSLVIPSSILTLYKDVPITAGKQIVFSSKEKQEAFFAKHSPLVLDKLSYIRHNGRIKVNMAIGDADEYDYLRFQNPMFDSRIYYCKISGWQYVSNKVTYILYEIDWFQTDMFNFVMSAATVDREQLSEEVWERAQLNPAQSCKYERQMRTPESLAVSREEERPYTTSVYYSENYESNMYPKLSPGSSDDDLCIFFKMALPSEITDRVLMRSGTPQAGSYRYFIDADNAGSQLLLSVLSALDGFIDYYNPSTEGLPTTCLYGYVSLGPIIKFEGTYQLAEGETASGPNNPKFLEGNVRMRNILDKISVFGADSSIIGMYALPRGWLKDKFNTCAVAINNTAKDRNYIVVKKRPTSSDVSKIGTVSINMPDPGKLHPKLAMFPFTYIRVETPSGEEKEYRFEDFQIDNAQLDMYVNFAGQPTMSMLPCMYKQKMVNPHEPEMTRHNFAERIDMDSIPTCPYTTDGYLSYISSRYASDISSHTVFDDNHQKRMVQKGIIDTAVDAGLKLASMERSIDVTGSGEANMLGSKFGEAVQQRHAGGLSTIKDYGTASAMGKNGGLIGQLVSLPSNIIQAKDDLENFLRPQMTMWDRNLIRSGQRSAADSAYQYARDSFATSTYHAGSGNYLPYELCDAKEGKDPASCTAYRFRVTVVKLRDDVLERYDEYLKTYGCNTSRLGNPLIYNFIRGSTDKSKLPKFVQLEGETFTYAKTVGASIYGTCEASEDQIENLFNCGCRFLKGDDM